VVGSRRQTTTAVSSPVPVDNLRGDLIRNIGTSDMDDVLRTLIPAYNVRRLPLDDESSLVRPATLRGLPPDNTLILVNGKRLHRSAVLAGAFGGAQGPDTSVIAPSSIDRVEVLRDGASAQYGSDAIAGVINFVTRDQSGGFSAEYRIGEFYEGDGRSERIALSGGLPLGQRGSAFATLEYGNTDKTVRAVQRFDARALEQLGAEGIPNPAQSWGQPTIKDDWRLFASLDMPVGESGEIYGFAHYASRKPEIEFFWRNPNGQFGVYTLGPERLVFDLTSDGSGNCPAPFTPGALPAPDFFFPTQQQYDADQAALALLAADPDCWTVNELYPSGYRPDFGADISDWGAVAGYRGEREDGLRYDLSLAAGESRVEYSLRNTLNPSLGSASPTEFSPGGTRQQEVNVNLDMAKPFNVGFLQSPLNVAWGLEWRDEIFEILPGDPASFEVGSLQSQGASIGSHGYPGYSPANAGEWSRSNWAAYLDLEADVTERLLLALALRYEDFEDFGSTHNGKAALRFQVSDWLALRASASTGFRAPTPGQSNFTRLLTELFDNELRQVGQIPPTNPVAQFYGGEALKPEESENLSAGLVLTPAERLYMTLDYFRIDLEDGIGLGPPFFVTPEDRQALIDLGVPGASDFAFIFFFANQFIARTEGFDVVVSYAIDWESAGTTRLNVAMNHTQVSLQTVSGANRRLIIDEEYQPRYRGNVTAEHEWRNLRLLARLSYYDDYVIADTFEGPPTPICTSERPNPEGTDECYSDKWVFDLEAAYTIAGNYTIVLGAENLFDTYPDKSYDYPDFSFGQVYHPASPFGYNGGFWYLRLRADF
jgi:iron complex outermembrane receptor protein